jgi:hypothetical protein
VGYIEEFIEDVEDFILFLSDVMRNTDDLATWSSETLVTI